MNILNSNSSEDFNFSVYNALGQLVRSYTVSKNSNTINVNDLERGCYFYKITAQGINQTGKIIKN